MHATIQQEKGFDYPNIYVQILYFSFVYSVRLEEKHVTEEKYCQRVIKLEPPQKITKPAIERKELHFVKFVTLAQTCWPGSLNLTAKVSTSFLRAVNLT